MVTDNPIDLSLDELAGEVAFLLEEYRLLGVHADHRVSEKPDARTIRYYTTLGLIDRPRVEGRQARYGRRHLLQLLAIKALQAINLPLSQIQARLYGLANDELESLLVSLSQGRRQQPVEQAIHSTAWREVIVEPGLKIMIEEDWAPQTSMEDVQRKLATILKVMTASTGSNGGVHDEHGS